ncbi:hypothetical protein [Pseudoduganella sp. OTU4001]|uniref:hypothetical protein n=1 Tax=Pseudoduganella sp. OTU4001 TaxID=3043854 RepID=UPI00313CA070
MRNLLPLMLATLLVGHAHADDKHHPPEAAAKPAQGKPAAATAADKRFNAAYDQLKKMIGQMDKIKAAKDPHERHRLMQEHMETMREGMQALRPAGGGAMQMMGCSMMKEPAAGDKDDAKPCPMMGDARPKPQGERLDAMEKRMDMMQMMMEQMVEREGQKPAPKQ